MEIRLARQDELTAVSDLLRVAWSGFSPPADASPDAVEGFEAYRGRVPDVWSRLDESVLYVALDDEGIVGTVTYYPAGQEYGSATDADRWPKTWASFRLLGVHPRARGRGLGRALTQHVIGLAGREGASHVAMHTTTMMAVARAMYERMGFVRVSEYDFVPGSGIVVEAFVLAFDGP